MSTIPPVDLDSETIQFDGHWFTREDLARRIKAMLDAGDYNVARPSQFLEQLTLTLANLQTLAIKITPEMADGLNALAARESKSAAGIIRELLEGHLGATPVAVPAPPLKSPASRRPTDPEMIALPVPAHTPLPGPGALKAASTERPPLPSIVTEEASPEEAATAVDLTSKKKEDEAIEKRWFGG